MKERPHPSLLPREKENHLPRFDTTDAVGWRMGFEKKERGEDARRFAVLEARPHPGLLPQEKENHLPRFDMPVAASCRMVFWQMKRCARRCKRLPVFRGTPKAFSLAPPERVRVRGLRRLRVVRR
jgi:hypothetical protein